MSEQPLISGTCDCCEDYRILTYFVETDNYHCADCASAELTTPQSTL